jgi:hypothetical protein
VNKRPLDREQVHLSRAEKLRPQAEDKLMAERLERLEARALFLDRLSRAPLPAQGVTPGVASPINRGARRGYTVIPKSATITTEDRRHIRDEPQIKATPVPRARCSVLDTVPGTLGERTPHMTMTTMPHEVDEAAQKGDCVESLKDAEGRLQHEAEARQQRIQDEGEFIRLSRRNAQLARSLTAEHQRERTSLQVTLMKLYVTLNPTKSYKWTDDFDVVMRTERRARHDKAVTSARLDVRDSA